MLRLTLLHPEILSALGRNGHGARVLITDANYPVATKAAATAARVFLNLSPGLVTVAQVLRPLLGVINVETALVMAPPDGTQPPVHAEFLEMLPPPLRIEPLKRADFYEQAQSAETCLVIATGEQRRFANLLLTIGVVLPEA